MTRVADGLVGKSVHAFAETSIERHPRRTSNWQRPSAPDWDGGDGAGRKHQDMPVAARGLAPPRPQSATRSNPIS